MIVGEVQKEMSYYVMHRYHWLRPQQFNNGLVVTEEKLKTVSGIS
jgi:putative transposase